MKCRTRMMAIATILFGAMSLAGPRYGDAQLRVVTPSTSNSGVGGGNLFETDRKKTRALKQAKTLVKDGEFKLSLRILQHILDFPEDSLWEIYGSTELGANTLLEPGDQRRKPGSCGKPIPGIERRC